MTVKMSEHGHAAIGLEITVTILPPGIEVTPIATFASMKDGSDRISTHEHELVELPSLGISWQQLIGSRFSTHAHQMEGFSIGLGASTFTCTCTPPPIPNYVSRKSLIMRTKVCTKKQMRTFLYHQIKQQVNQKIKSNSLAIT
jgi:hypothetical protein